MAGGLRIFISHGSADAGLATALAGALKATPGVDDVFVDTEGLRSGRYWQNQLHRAMAQCNCAIVLVTRGVLHKSDWVLKEGIVFGWRLDLEPDFSLHYVLAPDVAVKEVRDCGFDIAGFTDVQRVVEPLASLNTLPALVDVLRRRFPAAPQPTPFDKLSADLSDLLRAADRSGSGLARLAAHYAMQAVVADVEPHRKLADALATRLVSSPEQPFAVDKLVQMLKAWDKEDRLKLVNTLVPYWIDADASCSLALRAPLLGDEEKPHPDGLHAVTIAARKVAEFTAAMTVRRAFVLHSGRYRLAAAVGLGGGNMFKDLREELCEFAKQRRWSTSIRDDRVVADLRKSIAPIFVPLAVLPDEETLASLRREFPRAVFIAPDPDDDHHPSRRLVPDPDTTREAQEFRAWELAINAIDND